MSFINQIPKQKKRKGYSAPSYLLLKPTGLFFRIAVPSDLRDILGKREYQLALKTALVSEGRPKVLRLAILAQDAFNTIRELKRNSNMTKELDDKTISKIADNYVKKNLRSYFEVSLSRVPFSLEQKEEQDALHDKLSQRAFAEANTMNIRDMEGKADAILEHEGFKLEEVDKNSMQYKKLCLALKKAKATIYEELAKPDFLSSFPLFEEEEKQVFSTAPHIVAPAVPVAEAKTSPRFEEVVGIYLERKKEQGVTRDIPDHIKEFSLIVSDYYPTLCVHELSEAVVKKYYDDMYKLPSKLKRKGQKYKGKSKEELFKMDIPREDILAPKTLDTRFTTVKSFLEWVDIRYPLEKVKLLKEVLTLKKEDRDAAQKSTRRGFTTEELKTLFLTPAYKGEVQTFEHAHDFWMPLLALFTGARLNELVQLHLSDIKEVDGIHYLHITTEVENKDSGAKKVKSRAAKRKVPLHPFLIELGFLDRVAWLRKSKLPHLFHRDTLSKNKDNKIGNIVSENFKDYRRACGVGGQEHEHSDVVFHSFRHSVATCIYNQPTYHESALCEVFGHGEGFSFTAKHYKDPYPVQLLYDEVISKLNFHEVLGLEVLKAHAKKWEKKW